LSKSGLDKLDRRRAATLAVDRGSLADIALTRRHDQREHGSMTEFRAVVDGTITFSNGGGITVESFRLDLPSGDTDRDEIGRLLVTSLGLLMAADVRLDRVEVVEEAHKGTRGGPAGQALGAGQDASVYRLVDLSHSIRAGMVTLPGLPGPEITAHLSREASKQVYAEGTTFEIGRITMIANTGTYVDAPHHRFEDGFDLAGFDLSTLADLPAVVVKLRDAPSGGVGVEALAAYDVRDRAVLIETGDSDRFGTPEYVQDASFLTREAAAWLVQQGPRLVGIDAANIDDMTDGTRPAHTLLLQAEIPIVEHLTGLDQVPPTGARFFAVPPKVEGFGTFPVRAFARVPG
jgi:arylformamidase